MLDFLGMLGNYESRKVGRFDRDGLMVSTANVTDGDHEYETAVRHPDYNDGSMVIVEAYDSREDASTGHDRWVATMTAAELPAELRDCQNSGISQTLDGTKMVFPRKRQELSEQE